MFADRAAQQTDKFWQGAALVVEVVSPGDPTRDTEAKFLEYAQAGSRECRLVDPRDDSVTVYTLAAG